MDHHVARPRRTFVGLAAMAAGAVALTVGALPGVAGATGGDDDHDEPPSHHNPGTQNPCPDDGWYWHWGPHNQNEVPGEHTEDDRNIDDTSRGGDITFTISNIVDEGEGKAFDFTSSVPVTAVYVRGWQDEGNLNEFDAPVTEGTVTGGDDYIKHVIVCPAPETPPTTPPSSTPPSSTPPSSTPPSSTPPSSTPPSSTPPSSAPEMSTPSTAPPSSQMPTTTISSEGDLPNTGSNTGPLVAIGAGLLVVGVGLVAGTRRFWSRFV
jgi:LPXTG-motif cell wall-anchored protein